MQRAVKTNVSQIVSRDKELISPLPYGCNTELDVVNAHMHCYYWIETAEVESGQQSDQMIRLKRLLVLGCRGKVPLLKVLSLLGSEILSQQEKSIDIVDWNCRQDESTGRVDYIFQLEQSTGIVKWYS